jgi:hypothetical protein
LTFHYSADLIRWIILKHVKYREVVLLNERGKYSRFSYNAVYVFLKKKKLHNLYSSPDIIRQVKSRRMRWAGHVARMGEERKVYKVLVRKPEG